MSEMMDNLMGKAEQALEGFLNDQSKVDKAKEKADDLLGKYVGEDTASELTDTAEGLLRNFVDNQE